MKYQNKIKHVSLIMLIVSFSFSVTHGMQNGISKALNDVSRVVSDLKNALSKGSTEEYIAKEIPFGGEFIIEQYSEDITEALKRNDIKKAVDILYEWVEAVNKKAMPLFLAYVELINPIVGQKVNLETGKVYGVKDLSRSYRKTVQNLLVRYNSTQLLEEIGHLNEQSYDIYDKVKNNSSYQNEAKSKKVLQDIFSLEAIDDKIYIFAKAVLNQFDPTGNDAQLMEKFAINAVNLSQMALMNLDSYLRLLAIIGTQQQIEQINSIWDAHDRREKENIVLELDEKRNLLPQASKLSLVSNEDLSNIKSELDSIGINSQNALTLLKGGLENLKNLTNSLDGQTSLMAAEIVRDVGNKVDVKVYSLTGYSSTPVTEEIRKQLNSWIAVAKIAWALAQSLASRARSKGANATEAQFIIMKSIDAYKGLKELEKRYKFQAKKQQAYYSQNRRPSMRVS